MRTQDEPTIESRLATGLRRDLDVVLTSARAEEAARFAMPRAPSRGRLVGFGLATALGAGVLTIVGLQFLRSGMVPGVTATPTATLSASPGVSDIIILGEGERVQPAGLSEEVGTIVQSEWQFAEAHPNDVGYPWFDPATGEVILSAATSDGQALLENEAATLSVPYRIRSVKYSFHDLQQIQYDALLLRDEGVPNADLIAATYPDYRDNRAVIRIVAMNDELLAELAARFTADALAIEVLDVRPEG